MPRLLKILLRSIIIIFVLLNVIVAFHAYKFTHFYNNGEITVKKKEEKTGWDNAKEMFFGINAEKKRNDVTTDSTFKTVYLQTKDSLKLEAWYIAADSSKGTVLLFHGHGGNKSGVIKEAESFNKMGYNTLLLDFRAHGNSEGNTCTIGFNETEDIKLAYDHIKNKGEKNIVLWGISMGASTIAKAVKDYQLEPQKVILEMPFGTIKDAVRGRLKIMGLPAEPIGTLLTFWGGTEHGFWAFGMKPQEFASAIKCPVLLQWGKNDPRVSQSEEEILFKNISNTNKKFVIYETAGHESLCKKETAKWEAEVAAFLK
ncbi:MAG: alpha/beta hydrolase [Chitinophagaceae bacterium]|nr:alpha/beta hydrolase [Chitinophagaceae bacterium]